LIGDGKVLGSIEAEKRKTIDFVNRPSFFSPTSSIERTAGIKGFNFIDENEEFDKVKTPIKDFKINFSNGPYSNSNGQHK
jgi:hypothetical protein